YLRSTGRPEERIALVEAYMKEQRLFHTSESPEPVFTDTLSLDLNTVQPSVAGPRRPQDRIALKDVKKAFRAALPGLMPDRKAPTQKDAANAEGGAGPGQVGGGGEGWSESPGAQKGLVGDAEMVLDHGSLVIAAITSCTNTSNPSVMMAAGLLARKAVALGLTRQPWVKTSLAPG